MLLLLAAAAVFMALGEAVEGLIILAALLLNAAISFATEWRAGRSLARLRALVVPTTRVRRAGQPTTIAAAELHLPPNRLVWAAGLLGSAPLGAFDWLAVAVAVAWPVVLLETLERWRPT